MNFRYQGLIILALPIMDVCFTTLCFKCFCITITMSFSLQQLLVIFSTSCFLAANKELMLTFFTYYQPLKLTTPPKMLQNFINYIYKVCATSIIPVESNHRDGSQVNTSLCTLVSVANSYCVS